MKKLKKIKLLTSLSSIGLVATTVPIIATSCTTASLYGPNQNDATIEITQIRWIKQKIYNVNTENEIIAKCKKDNSTIYAKYSGLEEATTVSASISSNTINITISVTDTTQTKYTGGPVSWTATYVTPTPPPTPSTKSLVLNTSGIPTTLYLDSGEQSYEVFAYLKNGSTISTTPANITDVSVTIPTSEQNIVYADGTASSNKGYVNITPLSEGNATLTITVTDSDNITGSSIVSVKVEGTMFKNNHITLKNGLMYNLPDNLDPSVLVPNDSGVYNLPTTNGQNISVNATSINMLTVSSWDSSATTINNTSDTRGFLSGCSNLNYLELTDDKSPLSSLTNLGSSFMKGCTSLSSIDLSIFSNVTTIGNYFLSGCTISSIDLSKIGNVEKIGNSFMEGCTSLTELDMSTLFKLAKPIGADPEESITIGGNFVYNCYNLTTLWLGNILPGNFTSSNKSFASDSKSTEMFTNGVSLLAKDALDNFKAIFPDSTSSTPYRKWADEVQSAITYKGETYILADDTDPNKFCTYDDDGWALEPTFNLKNGGTLTIDFGYEENLNGITSVLIKKAPSNVTKLEACFLADTYNLKYFDTSGLTNIKTIERSFLSCCHSLTDCDLSGFSNVTSVRNGFLWDCTSLEYIDLSPMVSLTTVYWDMLAYNEWAWQHDPTMHIKTIILPQPTSKTIPPILDDYEDPGTWLNASWTDFDEAFPYITDIYCGEYYDQYSTDTSWNKEGILTNKMKTGFPPQLRR